MITFNYFFAIMQQMFMVMFSQNKYVTLLLVI